MRDISGYACTSTISFAGMISTQRSEGMHAYFDHYVNSRSKQYEIVMSHKIKKEFLKDYKSKNKVIHCVSDYAWERQFQHACTNSIFKLVQRKIKRLMYCAIPSPNKDAEMAKNEDGFQKYKIMEKCMKDNDFFHKVMYTVVFREGGHYFSCTCKKFESKGMLCCHIFKLLSVTDIGNINERYIFRRRRKNVHRRHTKILFRGGYPHMTEEYKKFRELEYVFQECIPIDYKEKIELMKRRLKSLKNELIK